jgi:hypothetical protein
MVEDLLFCKNITANTKARDLFEILNNFMSEIFWIGLNALVYVLTALDPCLAVMEDYRHLLEANPLLHCGPIVLFIEKCLRQNI